MPTLGEKIRTARLQRGLTQADLSHDLVTPSMMSQIESGKARPSYTLVTALADRLGLSVEYFLNNFTEQFTMETYLQQAELELLLGRPSAAIEWIEAIATSLDEQGVTAQRRHLLLARAYRMLTRFDEATRLLHRVREFALQTGDQRLQFQVYVESGHVEYAMNNPLGAMHEWKNAIEIGEQLSAQYTPGFNLSTELSRLSLGIAEILQSSHQREGQSGTSGDNGANGSPEATFYLLKAAEFVADFKHLRHVAEALAADSRAALQLGEAGQAKMMVERALTIIQSAQTVEQRILAQSKLSDSLTTVNSEATFVTGSAGHAIPAAPADSLINPWLESAMAVATANPVAFIEAELLRIEHAIKLQDAKLAQRRIARCTDLLEDYCEELPSLLQPTLRLRYRMRMAKAHVEHLEGRLDSAIAMAQGVAYELEHHGLDEPSLLSIWATLIRWAGATEREEEVFDLLKKMQQFSEKRHRRPVYF